jgi:hypothetical protein
MNHAEDTRYFSRRFPTGQAERLAVRPAQKELGSCPTPLHNGYFYTRGLII